MFDHHPDDAGEPADEAERRDREVGDTDWSVPAEGAVASRFAAPSGELAMVSLGDPAGEPVLLAPGVTGSKEDFVLVAPLLAAAGYHVRSFDLAGQYESAAAGPAPGRRYDYALFLDDMVALLEDAGPAHVLGYSFAGIVAQLVAVERPELVRSLTLMTCPPEPGNSFRGVRGLGPLSWVIGPRLGAALMIWGIETNKNHAPQERLAFVRHRFGFTDRSSVADVIGLMKHAPDVRDRLRAAGIPTLVAVGSNDLWPTGLHAEFAERIGARLAVYRTGHGPCETTPNALVRDMLALFARV
ncbi:MAG: alpha/beta hydrolase [Microbacteriaceae bacterium]|nr:alpha/beta hydrolase [Microbacteriaceae bacterium]